MMPYVLHDRSQIITPALVVFRDLVAANLQQMIAGDAARLRPHCKTHKMPAVAAMELAAGITKHKCATLAEAEMLATAGVRDIFLAYNPVGANVGRVVAFRRKFPDVNFLVAADHPVPVAELSAACAASDVEVGVVLDLDCGMHRTGIQPGEKAMELYRMIDDAPHLIAAGLHAYDGHHHQHDFAERAAAIDRDWRAVEAFRDQLAAAGLPTPRLIATGTPGFPVHARRSDPTLELSPGTTVFHDAGSLANFPDLPFTPAAVVLSRVVSRPAADLVTFDAGTKAIAADPPMEKRAVFPELPDARIVAHNEEHLVIRTAEAKRFQPGDEQFIIPWHICPTVAWHREAYVAADGAIVDRWPIVARDRVLSL
ncbi:MAG: D-TA family PLP-dependent enzyme, partial [Planctomycetales bacterium]|nr:D-TA family PLP-dependent enzyme [Planctomycetales bacterium]